MTDGQLLELFVNHRDQDAFEALVLRHGPMVLGLCRQLLRDTHEAEDAFQATFLVLVEKARTIRKHESLASWLYGVAYRLALRAKTNARRRAYAGRDVEMAATVTLDDLNRDEIRPVVHEEVARLPETYRAPVVLCYLQGHTHEEAAEQLEWPVGTVKGRLSRARELLRDRLTRRGLAVPMGLMAMLVASKASAAVPESLVEATVAASMRAAVLAGSALGPRLEAQSVGSSGAGGVATRPRDRLKPRRLVVLAGLFLAVLLIGWMAGQGARAVAGLVASTVRAPVKTGVVGRPDWNGPGSGPAASCSRDDR